MQVYDGAAWIAASSSGNVSLYSYEYIATAGQTSFSGADVNGQTLSYTANNIHVTYGGLDIPKADYVATNGTTVVLDDGAVVGTIVRIVAFQSFVVANTYTQAQADTLLAAKAKLTKSSTAPSSPAAGDMWFNTATSAVSGITEKAMAVYNGTAWQTATDGDLFTATGGTKTTAGLYTIHTFTSSGTFTPNKSGSVDALIVAGGGGGGGDAGQTTGAGGGGAGGFIAVTSFAVTATGLTVTIGAGGAGGVGNGTSGGQQGNGANGADSVFSSLTSKGGGGGGGNTNGAGSVGGSGGGGKAGGAGGSANQTSQSGVSGSSGFGNAGGAGVGYGGGGGGGASAAGQAGQEYVQGDGGAGKSNSFSGSATNYGGGGGGGGNASYTSAHVGAGGVGGGGNGTRNGNGVAASVNTGGGGGGSSGHSGTGGAGGSGIVIVRYLT
tara:strand:+ start:954 stop:2267 length:1314 start_codon:yes stop_codon:yes gene_type:complete